MSMSPHSRLQINHLFFSTEYLESRLEYNIVWSINPFIHNPYTKPNHHHHASGTSTPGPAYETESPVSSNMMTVQQMQGIQQSARKNSMDPHVMMSMGEQLGQPK